MGPALAEIHSHVANNIAPQIRTLETNNTLLKASLGSVESELHKRTVLIHGVPPFCGKKAIDDNMWYLLKAADLTHVDMQSVSNHLLTSTTSFIRVVFVTEAIAKQFFQNFRASKRYFRNRDPKNYTADTPIKIERDLSLTERLERQPLYALVDSLTKAPTSDGTPLISSYLKIDYNSLQAYNTDNDELVAMVIYLPSRNTSVCQIAIQPQHRTHVLETFPRTFQDRMTTTLKFLQAYQSAARHSTTTLRFHYSQTQDLSNVTPEQAIQLFPYEIFPMELTPDLLQTLAKNPSHLLASMTGMQPIIQQVMMDQGLDHSSFGKTGKGRSKDKGEGKGKQRTKTTWDSKGKGKGDSYERRTGKDTDRWSSYVPTTHSSKPKYSPQQNDDPWAQAAYGTDSRSRRATGGRDYSSESEMIIPCAGCMNLLGTNSDCDDCLAPAGVNNLQKLQNSVRYAHLEPFAQNVTPGFACPLVRARDQRCNASASLYGKGDCSGYNGPHAIMDPAVRTP